MKMNQKDAVLRNSLLQEMVKIKKLRFKDIEEQRLIPKLTHDILQRKANFEEFKAVYEDYCNRKTSLNLEKGGNEVPKTQSGSSCGLPRVMKGSQYVETINIELPLHYGADRAVQIIGNKIKPKRAYRTPKIHRDVKTKNVICGSSPDRSQIVVNKPKKVAIVEKLNTIEEVTNQEQESLPDIPEMPIREIEKDIQLRKEKIHKSLPKPPLPKPAKKKAGNNKIMSALTNINEKLQKMQEKYFNIPRIQYKNVNDCFTQSGNLEVLYENEKYPEQINIGDSAQDELKKISDSVLSDIKMQERIKEMNEMFPEFPKIEDTLREIETHLENIVNLKSETGNDQKQFSDFSDGKLKEEINRMWNGGNLTEILETLDNEYPLEESMTDEILQNQKQAKGQKRRTIHQQIFQVEDFCDRLSEIAHENSVSNVEGVFNTAQTKENDKQIRECGPSKQDSVVKPNKLSTKTDFIEGTDLQSTIRKSKYLSKEFNDVNNYSGKPMVKIFSENRKSFWKDKMKQVKKQNEDYSVESVTKMIDTLKVTLENSIYEPVI